MNSTNFKYLALVTELPATMLVFGYGLQWLDESYSLLSGYGLIIGIVVSLVLWIFHASYLMNREKQDE